MYDPIWEKAASTILDLEGGKTTDHAGPTNMGITLRFLIQHESVDRDGDGFLDGDYDRDGDIDQADLDMMDSVGALRLYKTHFWDKHGYGSIHGHDLVCIKLFDLAVNCGPVQAHKFLQRSARACGERIKDDGLIGPRTRAAVVSLPGSVLLASMRSEAAGFYRLIVSQRPDFQTFLNGWLRRAYEL